MVALTIGMATYQDFDGVYFTIQALRMYQDLTDTEILVVDNYGCEHTKSFVEAWAFGRYVLATEAVGTAAPRDLVFREANGEAVLCCDSHILFEPGAIARLKEYYRAHPDTIDLLQGPLVYDDLKNIATHFAPEWRTQMWGTWALDPRGADPNGEPFEIPMHGLGVFSCRKSAWLGFNPRFRGFGGEEGYIHEKFRQAGGRCLCLPWLRWTHRFGRPAGARYPLFVEDKLRNYVIGHAELGLDLEPVLEHFMEFLPEEKVEAIAREAVAGEPPGWASPAATRPEGGADAAAAAPMASSDVAAQDAAQPLPNLTDVHDRAIRRAIVTFVEDSPHLVQQLLALRESWLHVQSPDTDLVTFGPADVLARLPDDLVKIEQRPAADDPVWQGYRYINSVACLNGAGAEQLDRYTHLLRAHADTFITPAWNRFYPDVFMWGAGAYANDDDVRRRLHAIARQYGLNHRGHTNVGVTWYGPTEAIRRACAFVEMLTKHILTQQFASDPGAWPGWYRGVAALYAGEIAVNHCAPDGQRSDLLDAPSTSGAPIDRFPHIHCWHTDEKFSKHWFMAGRYTSEDAQDLDLGVVRDYCMAMSFRSIGAAGAPNEPAATGRSGTDEHAEDHREVASVPTGASEHVPAVASGNDPQAAGSSGPTLVRSGPEASMPLVSCICATYNRAPSHQHLLEEAIESFLRQTYPNKELIVLNDCPQQELVCDAPGVRVVNAPARFPTLGEKCEAIVDLARGELIAPWDDDDVSLPWRLALSVERLGDADYYNPKNYWYWDGNGLHYDHGMGIGHNLSLFTRTGFKAVGGYPAISLGYDAEIDKAFLSKSERVVHANLGNADLPTPEWFYIYRWGVNPVHVSSRHDESFYQEIGKRPVEAGRFYLAPHWRKDYVAETRRMLEATEAQAREAS